MRVIKAYTVIFIIGAIAYSLIEIIWRGYTHISMTMAGGICLAGLYCIERHFGGMSMLKKCLIGSVLITVTEFFTGCIVNRWLGLCVWDYSDRFLNIMGQICPVFSILWFVICIPAFGICMAMHKLFEKREKSEMDEI